MNRLCCSTGSAESQLQKSLVHHQRWDFEDMPVRMSALHLQVRQLSLRSSFLNLQHIRNGCQQVCLCTLGKPNDCEYLIGITVEYMVHILVGTICLLKFVHLLLIGCADKWAHLSCCWHSEWYVIIMRISPYTSSLTQWNWRYASQQNLLFSNLFLTHHCHFSFFFCEITVTLRNLFFFPSHSGSSVAPLKAWMMLWNVLHKPHSQHRHSTILLNLKERKLCPALITLSI